MDLHAGQREAALVHGLGELGGRGTPGGGQRVGERVTVFFENDQLIRIAGDYQPESDGIN